MTSLRQIEANRRNAQLSTGPVTEAGKQTSRRNAVRHGLTAETVIGELEDAKDYAAFEMAVTAGFEASTAVERELVLRLASLLWRLRRATAIERGLFGIEMRNLLQHRRKGQSLRATTKTLDKNICKLALVPDESQQLNIDLIGKRGPVAQLDDLTRSFVRLAKRPSYPLDRLSRYEARLWRQAYQILFTLQYLDRQNSWPGKRRSRRAADRRASEIHNQRR
jgi:hypothetical protein